MGKVAKRLLVRKGGVNVTLTLSLVLGIALTAACDKHARNDGQSASVDFSVPASHECEKSAPIADYFPRGPSASEQWSDSIPVVFAPILQAAGEPSLWCSEPIGTA